MGSFLVWDSRLPHGECFSLAKAHERLSTLGHTGNFPNQSDRFRIVQYIAFRAAEEDYKDEQKVRVDCFHTREQCPVVDEELAGFPKPHLTELGEKILGLRSWKAE